MICLDFVWIALQRLLRVRMTRENNEDGPRQTGDGAQRGGGDDGDGGGARGRVHQLVRRRGT